MRDRYVRRDVTPHHTTPHHTTPHHTTPHHTTPHHTTPHHTTPHHTTPHHTTPHHTTPHHTTPHHTTPHHTTPHHRLLVSVFRSAEENLMIVLRRGCKQCIVSHKPRLPLSRFAARRQKGSEALARFGLQN